MNNLSSSPRVLFPLFSYCLPFLVFIFSLPLESKAAGVAIDQDSPHFLQAKLAEKLITDPVERCSAAPFEDESCYMPVTDYVHHVLMKTKQKDFSTEEIANATREVCRELGTGGWFMTKQDTVRTDRPVFFMYCLKSREQIMNMYLLRKGILL